MRGEGGRCEAYLILKLVQGTPFFNARPEIAIRTPFYVVLFGEDSLPYEGFEMTCPLFRGSTVCVMLMYMYLL